jgi:hypothetical protein
MNTFLIRIVGRLHANNKKIAVHQQKECEVIQVLMSTVSLYLFVAIQLFSMVEMDQS